MEVSITIFSFIQLSMRFQKYKEYKSEYKSLLSLEGDHNKNKLIKKEQQVKKLF